MSTNSRLPTNQKGAVKPRKRSGAPPRHAALAMPHRGSARPSLFMLNTDWAGERLQGRRAVAEAAQGWRLAELLRGSGLELEDLLAQALVRDARTEFEEGD